MATKKGFKKNTAELFISAAEDKPEEPKKYVFTSVTDKPQEPKELVVNITSEPQEPKKIVLRPAQEAPGEFVPPKGYKLVKENKSQRMQLLVRPTTKAAIRKAAAAQGLSMNDLVNQILDEYAERQESV